MGRAGRERHDVVVACIVPLRGPAGIYGPSCESCIELAVEEINADGGLLGRPVTTVLVDGAAPPQWVAREIDALITSGRIDAVTGWHISPVRQAVAPVTFGRVPYTYAPLHEGHESTPGVFMTGETPRDQLLPAMDWMRAEYGIQRWILVGNDYVWPRLTAQAAREHARSAGRPLLGELYVPLGSENFEQIVDRIEASGAEGVLSLLVGDDGVRFNREFGARRICDAIPRLSPHVEENMLLAGGPESNQGLYSAAGYFEGLNTTSGLEFAGRYYSRFGEGSPALNSIGESCYEAMILLAQLVRRARSLDVADIIPSSEGLTYEGPRGVVRMIGQQLRQTVYVARADAVEFDIQAALTVA
ncbi:substrate-binding domain-containing protein [Kineosporia mesophila]|uniref:Substrate-binding domain-containing protein n=1 Tax=Kineosporia mesophila TaxID=566012 RepID=A0ABP7AD09_9ACTN|nr:substrate-binding domain-containing protein [Kineosporia mesophila]